MHGLGTKNDIVLIPQTDQRLLNVTNMFPLSQLTVEMLKYLRYLILIIRHYLLKDLELS